MSDDGIFRMEEDEDRSFIQIGTKVREILSKEERIKKKPRTGLVFADSEVNGARILNIKWDNGMKDFVDESAVEPLEGRPASPTEKRSMFSVLRNIPTSPPGDSVIGANGVVRKPLNIGDDEAVAEDEDDDYIPENPLAESKHSDSQSPKKIVSKQYEGETLNMNVIDSDDDEVDWIVCSKSKNGVRLRSELFCGFV